MIIFNSKDLVEQLNRALSCTRNDKTAPLYGKFIMMDKIPDINKMRIVGTEGSVLYAGEISYVLDGYVPYGQIYLPVESVKQILSIKDIKTGETRFDFRDDTIAVICGSSSITIKIGNVRYPGISHPLEIMDGKCEDGKCEETSHVSVPPKSLESILKSIKTNTIKIEFLEYEKCPCVVIKTSDNGRFLIMGLES